MIHTMDSLFIPGGFRPFPDDDDVYYYNGERLKLEGETENRPLASPAARFAGTPLESLSTHPFFKPTEFESGDGESKRGRRDVGVGTGR